MSSTVRRLQTTTTPDLSLNTSAFATYVAPTAITVSGFPPIFTSVDATVDSFGNTWVAALSVPYDAVKAKNNGPFINGIWLFCGTNLVTTPCSNTSVLQLTDPMLADYYWTNNMGTLQTGIFSY